ncbi:unnamed protein product [Rotaria magnacalcarata]|uniref:Uncharacterized protein n=1 Tax=Rotaria magnacalcarata TaxID=392030 RepID=A0A816WU70_9BILA|nr:unnamed protein product [Rotaria magnacalcarata]
MPHLYAGDGDARDAASLCGEDRGVAKDGDTEDAGDGDAGDGDAGDGDAGDGDARDAASLCGEVREMRRLCVGRRMLSKNFTYA